MVYPPVLDMVFQVGQALDQRPVIGEQQKTITVAVEPSGGVDIGHGYELLQHRMTRAFLGELREDAIRLIEQNVSHNGIIINYQFKRGAEYGKSNQE